MFSANNSISASPKLSKWSAISLFTVEKKLSTTALSSQLPRRLGLAGRMNRERMEDCGQVQLAVVADPVSG